MRGALGQLEGIRDIEIAAGNRNFDVEYDQAKVDVDRMLAALKAAGEPAKVRK